MSTSTVRAAPPQPFRQDAATIGLIGVAHSVSHFSQLLLAPLFPWLKDAFHVSYAQLGLLMTLFFTVSCTVQALSGFVVDRRGPLPVLLGGLGSIVLAALGYSASQSYWQLLMFSVVAGVGNGVFHPVDYTLINKKVSEARLGHAYSVHGVTGSLGWALAPALLVPIAITHSWRMAIVAGAAVAFAVWLLIWFNRERLVLPSSTPPHAPGARAESTFAFLRIPAVWVCFGFFLFFAASLSGVQTFAPEAARQLHQVERSVTGMCLSIYMVCSALGMIAGGFMLKDPSRCERIVGIGFGLAAVIAVTMAVADVPAMAVPVMFGLMGLFTGTAGPSRDLIVKRASPPNASGRVYGVVYSGLDIGQALAPLLYGALMDMHMPAAVWLSIAVVQGVLVVSAFNVRRARRTRLQPA